RFLSPTAASGMARPSSRPAKRKVLRGRPQMRTSFHHQVEAQHPNFQLPTRQADYPIFRNKADMRRGVVSTASVAHDPKRLEQDFCLEETSWKIVCCDVLKLARGLRAAYTLPKIHL